MSLKITAFLFALARWAALVALALVPTVIVVVLYRKLKGEPLWSMRDLPLAAEVTLCLAWLSTLFAASEMTAARLEDGTLAMHLAAVAAASLFAAVPVALGLKQVDDMKRVLGVDRGRGKAVPAQAATSAL